ncbi:hypothetical protein [Microbacterium sp. CIAB417]|uniref:hypothetical protein n=1 Tax=Microbacterium sp. CIAB417 TaxID=2860287 RepID=UPI001FAE6C0C|nr:hypothetical protein [Microbacterium sp. CIAB417]
MSLIHAYERAQSTPLRQRWAVIVTGTAVAYLAVAAAVMFYLLPVGFALGGAELLLAQVVVAFVGAAAVAYVATAVRRGIRQRALLWSLADDAGWAYVADVSDRIWGGSIDEQIDRSARTTMDYLDASSPVPFDTARRVFSVGDGEGASVHTTQMVRIPLTAEAPRIVLRSRNARGALSALPRVPRGRHELTLEGGFSDVFAVSVPTGYEVDALYLLTPDLMAILLDHAADCDLEIVDGTLHVYLDPVDLTDPAQLRAFLTVVGVLHDRFGRRTALYRDEAAPVVDAGAHRTAGDSLSAAARSLDTRARLGPVVAAVLAPLVPLLLGLGWVWLTD